VQINNKPQFVEKLQSLPSHLDLWIDYRSNQGRVVDQVTVYNGSDQVIHQTESDRLRNHELIERHIQELRRQNNAGLGAL